MSTPSAMPRDPDELDRGFQDALRRISSPATLPEQGPPRAAGGARRNRRRHRREFRLGARARARLVAELRDARVGRLGSDIERLEASLRWLQRQERPPRLADPRTLSAACPLRCADRRGQPALRASSLAAVIGAEAPGTSTPVAAQLAGAIGGGNRVRACGGDRVLCLGRRLVVAQRSVPATAVEASVPAQVVTASLPKRVFESRLIEARDDDVPTTAQGEPSTALQAGEPPPARTVEQATAPMAVAALQPNALAMKRGRRKRSVRLMRTRSRCWWSEPSNSSRPAIWSPHGSCFSAPHRPATPPLRSRSARLMIRSCWQGSGWSASAPTWRRPEAGIARPRAWAHRKRRGGLRLLRTARIGPIVSAVGRRPAG